MLKSNFTTEKGNMQYPVGKADGYFVLGWSVFVTHDHLLGIVTMLSLRGRQCPRTIRAQVVCIRYAIGYRSVSAGSARTQCVRRVVNISHP